MYKWRNDPERETEARQDIPDRIKDYLDVCPTCAGDLRDEDHNWGCPDGDLNSEEALDDPTEPTAAGHTDFEVENDRVYRRWAVDELGIPLTLEQAGMLMDAARKFVLLRDRQPEIDAWFRELAQRARVSAAEMLAGWDNRP